MDYNLLLYFLILIDKTYPENDISSLITQYGARGKEINKTRMYAEKEELILKIGDAYVITEKGKLEIKKLRKRLKLNGSEKFVVPCNSYKIPKISSDTVYIPKRK